MTNKTNLKPYFDKGIDYDKYLSNEQELLASEDDFEYRNYHTINLKRMERNNKQAVKLESLQPNVLPKITNKKMLIISEGWCGDAAQIVPYAAQLAKSANMELKIVYRDKNHELMEEYLTNGGMAIPVIISVDENYDYINHFAPRPKEAQDLMLSAKETGVPKEEINIALQKWYNIDKGEKVTQELIKLL